MSKHILLKWGLFIITCFLHIVSIKAQSEFQIRIKEMSSTTESQVCYEVAVRANDKSWYLAGQNYRLFYDARLLQFKEGVSLLGPDYQSFNLVQNKEHINFDATVGCLHYSTDLGFLNYSIDLLSTTNPSATVPADGSWLPTTQLCFVTTTPSPSILPTLTWGRETLTSSYAPSYVAISEFVEAGKLTSAIGVEFFDTSPPCESIEIEERTDINTPVDSSTYNFTDSAEIKDQHRFDIRLVEANNQTDKLCFQLDIRSATEQVWQLAGQNYRLYYDAEQMYFDSGSSLLDDRYQEFTLVQDIANVDASTSNGCLLFERQLGFLNYAIDLLNTKESSASLPIGKEWVATSEICFNKRNSFQTPSIILARKELTADYATSFIEISAWQSKDNTQTTIGNLYQDIGDACQVNQEGIFLNASVLLQACYDSEIGLMQDSLRSKKLIPLNEPYSDLNFIIAKAIEGIEKIDTSILEKTGAHAIVDWVMIELRNAEDPIDIIGTRCALIKRNGSIVDLDGESPVRFELDTGMYYVSIRHRNHLGIMSETPIRLDTSRNATLLNFSKETTPIYGEYGRTEIEGKYCLWSGNADANKYIVFEGSGIALPDSEQIFFDIFSNEKNYYYNYNFISKGYYTSDLNMDGELRYQGVQNERDDILFNVVLHPQNPKYLTNFFIEEQLPK